MTARLFRQHTPPKVTAERPASLKRQRGEDPVTAFCGTPPTAVAKAVTRLSP